ncbi:AAA-domain-containing protein [Penicillium capsulatum]|uniref:AAA-domain-containing protein n=1 Tax=Penicillium capsulatum TaxID=69766 RepID=A0A9W9IP01_9EURO|nr:AAA-domain-containing protein [Penicillium capsulatum]KAJ6121788.1 AAA-domain-containing protein [Penicillium capsulatum]
MRYSSKRTLEELATKSDSDDEDYDSTSERAPRRSRSRKLKSSPKKNKSGPAKKKQRRDSDIVSDDASLSDDSLSLSIPESAITDDSNVPRNARGTARRRTTQSRPQYQEASEADDEDIDADPDVSPPKKKKVVKLKLRPEILGKPEFSSTRRTTRGTRDPSEDIVALSASGRAAEIVQRGTMSPEPKFPPRKSQASKQPVIAEASMETSEVIQQSLEIDESDLLQASASGEANGQEPADVEMTTTEGVIPESQNEEAKLDDSDASSEGPVVRRSNRGNRKQLPDEDEEEHDDEAPSRPSSRKKPSSQRRTDEESDFEPEEEDFNDDEASDSEDSNHSPRKASQARDDEEDSTVGRRAGLRKLPSRSRNDSEVADELAEELQDLRGGRPRRRAAEIAQGTVYDKPRRNRKEVNYQLFPQNLAQTFDEPENDFVVESPSRRGRGGASGGWQRSLFPTYGPFGGGGPSAILGPSGAAATTGGVDSDSSDDEAVQPKNAGLAASGLVPQAHSADAGQNLSGTPANFGKVRDKQTLADADPLGVDTTVNFDSVGGLQGHIDQLKEMVSLPLLYPEIFQRFHITPPRGVLFHGPPGTGKTLLARALANSVSSEGRKVTFYMRKGADALSKWVGEAERQLRLLFEEARKTQPSIIFFDEIDGLAPVRSSKQEQIHASIVSTLLALMDGMDGRGQVIVIGATNRPDSVDPALRRPGRFDREFYFPLPNIDGRRAILDIHTKGWNPPLPDDIKEELAKITKGYGGADLRALCTEAALNAVQRKYPQIYKSDQKLVIDPKKIDVTPKDFMLAVKKMVPSSERSTSSGATALPQNVEPLLRRSLATIQASLSEILPQRKRLTALEEAQFEEPQDGNSFRREQIMQEFDKSRVFRPRLLLRGAPGMGQQYLAAALLHQFEGLHVQAFDLPTLLSDSTRSPEATVIQLFSEVKRHKPSVIYIPNIQTWFETVGPTVISTFTGLLRSIPPSDPVLLLGVLESSADEVDAALVKNLFGYSTQNLYDLSAPDHVARHEFFERIIEYIKTSPSDFPDPENRKKRQLEELEVAPPPPKIEIPVSKAELKAQKKKDRQTLNLLKIRIQPIMDQIKKYKRFRTGVIDESQIRYLWDEADPNIVTSDLPPDPATFRPYEMSQDKHGVPGLRETISQKFYYNMEIVTMEKRLSNGYYKRPSDFLADIKRIAKDARQHGDQERVLRANELLSNVEVDISTIEQAEPALVAECENVYQRELAREKEAVERAKRAEEEATAALRPRTPNVPHGNTESAQSSGPVHLGEWVPKTAERPVTPARQSLVNPASEWHHGGGSDLNEPGPQGQSHGSQGGSGGGGRDGDVYMTNSEDLDNSGSKDTQADSFGPSAQPKPPFSCTAPSEQVRRESGLSSFSQKGPMTPMAPGSQPADYANEASTTQTTSDKKSDQSATQAGSRNEHPDLTQYPDRVSQEDHLPDTQQGGSSQTSRELQIDLVYVEQLHASLVQQTGGCSVEQLEQISTCLMDQVWRHRSEWNRTTVAKGIAERFNVTLRDMQSLQEMGNPSFAL